MSPLISAPSSFILTGNHYKQRRPGLDCLLITTCFLVHSTTSSPLHVSHYKIEMFTFILYSIAAFVQKGIGLVKRIFGIILEDYAQIYTTQHHTYQDNLGVKLSNLFKTQTLNRLQVKWNLFQLIKICKIKVEIQNKPRRS